MVWRAEVFRGAVVEYGRSSGSGEGLSVNIHRSGQWCPLPDGLRPQQGRPDNLRCRVIREGTIFGADVVMLLMC